MDDILSLFTLLTACFCHQGAAHLFYPETEVVKGTYGEKATIMLMSNFSAQTRYDLKSFYVEVDKQTVATGASSSFSPNANDIFGDRLQAVKLGEDQYMMLLSKLGYNDAAEFKTTVLFTDSESDNALPSFQDVTINLIVEGGPDLCLGNLPATTVVNGSAPLTVAIVVCGNPTPVVVWTKGTETLTGVSEAMAGEKSRYKYSVTLPTVSPSMCGQKIAFTATGHNGNVKVGKTQLLVQFEPSTTIVQSYRMNSTCIKVHWDAVDIGSCALKYEVTYHHSSGETEVTVSDHPDSSFVHCTDSLTKINGTSVRVHYDGKIGSYSAQAVVLLEDPNKEQETGASVGNDGDDEWKIIVGVVVGVFLLILLVVLIIYCCCCDKVCGCGGCCGCCDRKNKQVEYGVTNSLGFQYKKNSKKKTKNIKVVLDTNETNETTVDTDTVSTAKSNPVVIVDEQEEPEVIYVGEGDEVKKDDMKYFDPVEFDVDADDSSNIQGNYANSTYDYDDDSQSENKPSFLI